MLPSVDITITNGANGATNPNTDGVFAVVAWAAAVSTTFVLEQPYLIRSLQDLTDLGVTDNVDNHRLYKFVSEFYNEAPVGQPLYIFGVARNSAMAYPFTGSPAPIKALLDYANGDIKGVFTIFHPSSYTGTYVDGLDQNVLTTAGTIQTYLDNYTDSAKAPLFAVMEGFAYQGIPADLPDLTTNAYNRVGIVLGDTESRSGSTASKGAALGFLGGRLSAVAVQVNPGRVKDGALNNLNEIYLVDDVLSLHDIETIHDKGFITFRRHVGKGGIFFTNAPTATDPATDDYRTLMARRIVDKAYRICYQVLVDELLSDVPTNQDGTIWAQYASEIEGRLRAAVGTNMASIGNLSSTDENPSGCVVTVDRTHNVVTTGTLPVTVGLFVKGYLDQITVNLGQVPVNN